MADSLISPKMRAVQHQENLLQLMSWGKKLMIKLNTNIKAEFVDIT